MILTSAFLLLAGIQENTTRSSPQGEVVNLANDLRLGEEVVIIAKTGSPKSHDLTIQDFVINGEHVIPIFPDVEAFRSQAAGSGFEDQAMGIKTKFLLELIRGDEIFMLNPGGPNPRRLTAAELRAAAGGNR